MTAFPVGLSVWTNTVPTWGWCGWLADAGEGTAAPPRAAASARLAAPVPRMATPACRGELYIDPPAVGENARHQASRRSPRGSYWRRRIISPSLVREPFDGG